jgi:small subunit ribosomal protein S4
VDSRTQGRHFVRHNHFLVNGKKVNIPSYLLRIGDVIEIREKSKKVQAINDSLDAVVRRGIPQWLELEKENLKGSIKAFPVREDISMPIQEQLIVELYSK